MIPPEYAVAESCLVIVQAKRPHFSNLAIIGTRLMPPDHLSGHLEIRRLKAADRHQHCTEQVE